MDYEKAYNDALKRAKAMIEVASNPEEAEGYASTIFPELADKDEAIRTDLIRIVTQWREGFHTWNSDVNYCNRVLAWLNKQKSIKFSAEDDAMLKHIISSLPKMANGHIEMLPSCAEGYAGRLELLRQRLKE